LLSGLSLAVIVLKIHVSCDFLKKIYHSNLIIKQLFIVTNQDFVMHSFSSNQLILFNLKVPADIIQILIFLDLSHFVVYFYALFFILLSQFFKTSLVDLFQFSRFILSIFFVLRCLELVFLSLWWQVSGL
jgi:hypothetical protein